MLRAFSFWSNKLKFNREKFYSEYRKHFGALQVGQVQGLNFLLDAIEKTPAWNDLRHIAYLFSTCKHETAHTFQPITEYGSDRYFQRYEGRGDLGNTVAGDGLRFKGRGFAQITGRKNYTRFSKLLNIDLVKNPKAVLDPNIAFRIITLGMHKGYFTGKKLTDYINDEVCDYRNARKIINGLDKASTLAGYAQRFYQILRAAKARDLENIAESEIEFNDSALNPTDSPTIHSGALQTTAGAVAGDTASVPSQTVGGQVVMNPTPIEGNPQTSASMPTEIIKTKEVDTPAGKETVETKQEIQQHVAIEKTQPSGFLSKLWKKITGIFGGAITTDVITEKAAQANALGLSPEMWKRIFYLAVIAGAIYLIYEIVDHVQSMKRDKEITKDLIQANSTDNNIVRLVPPERLDEMQERGYEIVRR